MTDNRTHGPLHRLGTLVPLLSLALLVISCAPAAPGASGPGSSGGSQAASAPKTLRIGMQAQNEPRANTDGPTSPAPYGGSGSGSPRLEHYFMFHANLTMFDIGGNVVVHAAPQIPSIDDGDWKILPSGGMEVTWKVRPDIVWHDGKPLTADDFVFGFQVLSDPDLPHTPRGELTNIAEVRATDAHTFVATWKTQSIVGNSNPYDGIPAISRSIFGDLYATGDKTAFENSALWNKRWVGLGPYRLTRWELGSFIEGTAFDQHFLGRPKIDRVIIKYIGDVNALIANALSGDIDVIPLGAQLDVPQMVAIREAWASNDGGLTLPIPKGVRTIYLQFRDPSVPWVQDLRVRQALLHATDRDGIVETLISGLTTRADFFAPPDDPAYRLAEQRGVPRYPFDPTRAERLLADAGWTRGADRVLRNGAGEIFHIDVTASGQGGNVQEASTVASQWSAAGFQSAPTPYPAAAENAAEIRHRIPGALIWPYNFSQTVLRTFTAADIGSEQNRWRGGNYGGYVNPAYEGLYTELTNTFEASKRTETAFAMLKLLNEQLPALPVFVTPLGLVARKGVEGPGTTSPYQAANAWNIYTWDIKDR